MQGQRATPMPMAEMRAHALAHRQGELAGPGHCAAAAGGGAAAGRTDARFRESEVADEVQLFNCLRGKQVEYLSYTTGRTERDAEAAQVFQTALAMVHAVQADAAEAEEGSEQKKGGFEGYELLTELGRGGMGLVHLARQEGLGRMVALKTLPMELRHEGRALTRFHREMRVLGSLDHPNIVKFAGCGDRLRARCITRWSMCPARIWKK